MSISLKKENNIPILVGLTGGIGSGKSTVAKIFESLGVLIFNSDAEAKKIINSDTEIIKQVVSEFGEVYKNGKLDTKKMAQIVFNDKQSLEILNDIIHPKVKEYFERWVEQNKTASILIKEAAILIESGAYKDMDKIILVIAPEDERIKRVSERDKVSIIKVKERIIAQLSDDEKLNYADFTINNDGKELVVPQVLDIYKKIIKPQSNN